MRAVRYYGPGDVRLDEVPEPTPSVKQVKIKVRPVDSRCHICGSDLHSWHEILPVSPTATKSHVVTQEKLPVIMGHEFSGVVVQTGPEVDASRFHIGGHVVVEPLLSCMQETCPFCSAGSRNLCRNATFIGIGGRGGGLAEYICVDQDLVYPLPPNVPLDVGALMEPLAVAWHAVKRSNIKAGDKVLVLGAGPIGLLAARVARAFGAAWVGVSEPALKRRELALKNGASAVFDPTVQGTDVVSETARITAGRGVDIVLDCAGTQKTLDTAFMAVKPRGHIVNVAVWEKRPLLDIDSLTYKEVNLTSVLAYDLVHPEMLRAIAEGRFRVEGLDSLVTRRISLEDVVNKGIKALIYEKDEHVKILVSPDLRPEAPNAKL
ncbi:alcohol dehydrogenase GroES domain protein [Pilatotrama ljubarskyi]|nr:alcohol dehydrogenase GroES domain protein [Pilatotrama ljubarskyi]